MAIDVRACVNSDLLDVMTFLNEVVQRFPNAISFAPGRPMDHLFDVSGALAGIDRWVAHTARATGKAPHAVLASLGQYGNTAGIIQDAIARHLAVDCGIQVEPDAVLVTSGCQEAMVIALLGLFDPARDTLLVSDPTYIGITGMARLAGIRVHPVPSGPEGLEPQAVDDAARAVRSTGRRPRALYDIPDFNNPLGTCLPLAARHGLLEVAVRHDMLILEDNPYGAFAYDGATLPTLKALDTAGTVIYLGSFAKTLFPGLRIGYLVAEQAVTGQAACVAATLSKVKSLTTVNTSPLMQAIVGATLLEHDGSLAPIIRKKLPHYRANRDRMVRSLDIHLGEARRDFGVKWNNPGGGFFLTLALPFPFGADELDRCAREYGVIVCPMAFFSLLPGRESEVRLSFSYVQDGQIDEGVGRLASFVKDETATRGSAPLTTRARAGGVGLRA
jgi:(S)-3,5-dihydroxyphenylglycine transaminase